jgi:hypothetical protein
VVSRSNLEKLATTLNVQNAVRCHASRRTFTSTLNSQQQKITKFFLLFLLLRIQRCCNRRDGAPSRDSARFRHPELLLASSDSVQGDANGVRHIPDTRTHMPLRIASVCSPPDWVIWRPEVPHLTCLAPFYLSARRGCRQAGSGRILQFLCVKLTYLGKSLFQQAPPVTP